MPEDRHEEFDTASPKQEKEEERGNKEVSPETEEEPARKQEDGEGKESQSDETLSTNGPKLHVRKRGTGTDDLPDLERADEGLTVRLSHDGEQELDELLVDIEKRGSGEEEDYGFESQIDEEAEEQKKEKHRLRAEEKRKREREYYARKERLQDDEYFEQAQKGIEKYLEEEREYDIRLRSRYEYDGYGRYDAGSVRTGADAGFWEIVEENDPQFFENAGVTVYGSAGKSYSFGKTKGISYGEEKRQGEEKDQKKRVIKAPSGNRQKIQAGEKRSSVTDGLRVSGGWKPNEKHTPLYGRRRKEDKESVKTKAPDESGRKTGNNKAVKARSGITSPGRTAPGIAGASLQGIITGPGGYIKGIITGESYRASEKALEEGRKREKDHYFGKDRVKKAVLSHGVPAPFTSGKRQTGGAVSATEEFYLEKKLRGRMIRLGRDSEPDDPNSTAPEAGVNDTRTLEDRIAGRDRILEAKIRDGRMRGMEAVVSGNGMPLKRRLRGPLSSQSARMNRQTKIALRFLSKRKQSRDAGTSLTQSALEGMLPARVKRLLVAAAKKALIGVTVTAVGAGTLLGGNAYSRFKNDSFNNYYYPVQAHMPASEGSETTMTQEAMAGMTERMKAYGIPLSQDAQTLSGSGTIRIHIPGYKNVSGSSNRWGDCQIITDGSGNCLIIDGGCGRLSDSMIEYLNTQGITRVSIMISHWDADHTWGFIQLLRETTVHIDKVYCFPTSEVMGLTPGEAIAGQEILDKASDAGGEIVYIPADKLTQISCGAVRMITWRKGDPSRGSFSTQANDMSIQVYFPDLYYYTTGDMIYYMSEFLDQIKGSTIKCLKTPHHGNGAREDARKLKDFGTEIAWDNNVSGYNNIFEIGTRACVAAGFQVIETNGDIEMTAGGGAMTVTGDGKSFTYRIPYKGGASGKAAGGVMQQVCEYAKSWAGKIPYGSAWNGTDPNNERWLPLQEGRPSDCSWFVYWCLYHFGLVGEDFIHSYEWGNNTEKYAEFGFVNVGTDMSTAIPGDVICTGAGTASNNSHVAIYIGDGKVAECGDGVGTTISNAPGSPRQIVRYMGASTTPVMGSVDTEQGASESRYGFTPQTESIVKAHMNDFTYDTYDEFMASHGGALTYVRSLGGVFAKWAGRDAHVKTAGEFQEIAEYVMGLYTIWGVDYHGGESHTYKFNQDGGEKGRFYKGQEPWRWFSQKPVEQVLFEDKEHIVTDCGCGIYHIMQKAGLYDSYAEISTPEKAKSCIDAAQGGKIIYNYNELQVGDMIQMFKGRGWRHVAVVGEIRPDGTVITYDTGNRYVTTANYKKIFKVDASNAPVGDYDVPGDRYVSWFGVRIRSLSQTGGTSASFTNTATQGLAKIRVNSVKVDGKAVDKSGITMENFKDYSRGDISTANASVSWQFTDMHGNIIGSTSGAAGSIQGMAGQANGGSAEKILRVAESHLGTPYIYGGKSWEKGVDCSYFVTAVLQEAGVYHGGYMTSFQWASYGREVPDITKAQAGDIIISNGGAHVSLYDGEKYVYEAKGAQWGCVHDRLPGGIVTIRRILPDDLIVSGGTKTASGGAAGSGTSAYNRTPSGNGPSIDIPDGLGDIFLYMGWQCINSPSSNQYRLREQAGQKFDREGFGIINGRYVIACSETFGKVGDYVDFYKTDGSIFHCIIGDMKSKHDAGYNKWGHKNGHNVIEFVVDKDTWYPDHANPGTPSFHPEWKGNVCRAVNLGSYYDDPDALMLKTSGSAMSIARGNSIDEAAMFLKKQILSMTALGSYYDDPADMEKYGKYCYDILDYTVCGSHGADIEYTTIMTEEGAYMTCEAKITVVCSQPLMEEHDKNYTSWELKNEKGDLMPAHYMSLDRDVFELVFNVDTSVKPAGYTEGGEPKFDTEEEKEVYRALRALGYGPVQTAGMMANIYYESHFRPDADNGAGAHGLFQWMGGRFERLKKLAASRNTDWTDIRIQCQHAFDETHGGSGWGGYTAQKEKFESTTDPYEAGALFSRYWERHGTNTDGIRGSKAREYYQIIMSAGSGAAADYVQWAIGIANNDSIGYCQHHRNHNPEYDCSSLVYYSLYSCGYDVGPDGAAFTTYHMDGPLTRLGFEKVHISSYDELVPGDILWKSTHTELYIGNGKSVGAHGNEKGRGHAAEEAQHGDQTGGEISVDSIGSWEWVYRKR